MKYVLAISLLLVALYFSVVAFNEVHAWAGIFLGLASIGGFYYFIYKQIKNYDNDEKKF